MLATLASAVLVSSLAASPTVSKVDDAPEKPWEHWVVRRPEAPNLDAYALRDEQRRPVVVYLPGSHCVPLFFYRHKDGKRRLGSTNLFEEALEDGPRAYHFVAVERRNLHSFVDLDGDLDDHCSTEHGSVSKEDRVADAASVVTALASQPWAGEILLIGHSEGAEVAAGVARRLGDGALRAIGSLSGGGPTQFFDHVMEARREHRDGDAQAVFDELLQLTSASPPSSYRGHPVERYRSFAIRSTELDDLRDLHVPVFIAHGTRDRNSAVESADLLASELLRADAQRAVRYLILPGLDHGYSDGNGTDHRKDVLDAFVAWGTAPTLSRGVETRVWRPAATERVRYLGIDQSEWPGILRGLAAVLPVVVVLLLWLRRRTRGQEKNALTSSARRIVSR